MKLHFKQLKQVYAEDINNILKNESLDVVTRTRQSGDWSIEVSGTMTIDKKDRLAAMADGLTIEDQDYDNNYGYAEKRRQEYPKLEEQMDALWHAMDRGEITMVPEFYDPIKATKDKYAKPAEDK